MAGKPKGDHRASGGVKRMFSDIPVDVSLAHAGERIRKNDVYVELGGPDIKEKFELVKVRQNDQVNDGAITIIGPDIADMEPAKNYPHRHPDRDSGPGAGNGLRGSDRAPDTRVRQLYRGIHAP